MPARLLITLYEDMGCSPSVDISRHAKNLEATAAIVNRSSQYMCQVGPMYSHKTRRGNMRYDKSVSQGGHVAVIRPTGDKRKNCARDDKSRGVTHLQTSRDLRNLLRASPERPYTDVLIDEAQLFEIEVLEEFLVELTRYWPNVSVVVSGLNVGPWTTKVPTLQGWPTYTVYNTCQYCLNLGDSQAWIHKDLPTCLDDLIGSADKWVSACVNCTTPHKFWDARKRRFIEYCLYKNRVE